MQHHTKYRWSCVVCRAIASWASSQWDIFGATGNVCSFQRVKCHSSIWNIADMVYEVSLLGEVSFMGCHTVLDIQYYTLDDDEAKFSGKSCSCLCSYTNMYISMCDLWPIESCSRLLGWVSIGQRSDKGGRTRQCLTSCSAEERELCREDWLERSH